MMDRFRFRQPPVVRVRRPKPRVSDVGDEGEFENLVHQAEAVRRNAPLPGDRVQKVEAWIEVAGQSAEVVVPFFAWTVRFPRRPRWERWRLWDRAPFGDLRLPSIEDLEQERRHAGAVQVRLWLETIV